MVMNLHNSEAGRQVCVIRNGSSYLFAFFDKKASTRQGRSLTEGTGEANAKTALTLPKQTCTNSE